METLMVRAAIVLTILSLFIIGVVLAAAWRRARRHG
jgi:hypothetical protein